VVVVEDGDDAPPRRRKTRQTKKQDQKQQKAQKRIAQRGGFNPPPPGEQRFVPNEVLLNIAGSTSAQALSALARRHRLTQLEARDFTLPPRRLARLRINDGRPVAAGDPLVAAGGEHPRGAAELLLLAGAGRYGGHRRRPDAVRAEQDAPA
jgi:hypothetical protein